MSNFLKLLEENGVNVKRKKPAETITLKSNFKELVSEALKDILSKNSSFYAHIVEKGIDISFEIKMPSDPVSGHMAELVSKYEEDMSW